MSDQPEQHGLSFTAFVLSLASTAAIHFGDLPDPASGGRAEPNLAGAAQMIEILAVHDQVDSECDREPPNHLRENNFVSVSFGPSNPIRVFVS